MPFIPHQNELETVPHATRLSAVGSHAARKAALVLLVLTVSVAAASAQQQRLPIDMTQYNSETEYGLYQPQRWQPQQQAAGTIVQASFTTPQPLLTTPEAKTAKIPFISLSDDAAVGASSPDAAPMQDGVLVQLATWTIIVLCLCVLTILGIRRWQRSRGMLPTGGQSGRVLDTLVLGPGRSVSLIQIQGQRAFVGCDASGIRTIAMAAPSFADAFHAEMESPEATDASTNENLDAPSMTV